MHVYVSILLTYTRVVIEAMYFFVFLILLYISVSLAIGMCVHICAYVVKI